MGAWIRYSLACPLTWRVFILPGRIYAHLLTALAFQGCFSVRVQWQLRQRIRLAATAEIAVVFPHLYRPAAQCPRVASASTSLRNCNVCAYVVERGFPLSNVVMQLTDRCKSPCSHPTTAPTPRHPSLQIVARKTPDGLQTVHRLHRLQTACCSAAGMYMLFATLCNTHTLLVADGENVLVLSTGDPTKACPCSTRPARPTIPATILQRDIVQCAKQCEGDGVRNHCAAGWYEVRTTHDPRSFWVSTCVGASCVKHDGFIHTGFSSSTSKTIRPKPHARRARPVEDEDRGRVRRVIYLMWLDVVS